MLIFVMILGFGFFSVWVLTYLGFFSWIILFGFPPVMVSMWISVCYRNLNDFVLIDNGFEFPAGFIFSLWFLVFLPVFLMSKTHVKFFVFNPVH